MQLRVIPLLMVLLVSIGAVWLITRPDPESLSLGAPVAAPLLDVDGVETEVAIAPDGVRYAVIASGDLWYIDFTSGLHQKLTETAEPEVAPSWMPDGSRITFTRGPDTFSLDPETRGEERVLEGARQLTWSPTGGAAFVRDRGLWMTTPETPTGVELLAADAEPDIDVISPRFSPDGNQIVFIKSGLGLRGEVWKTEIDSGLTVPVIADRAAENPTSVDWVRDNGHIAYLTDRSGGLAVWYVDLEAGSMVPLTPPLMERAAATLGIATHGDRIVVPRHFIQADITATDGHQVVATDRLEMEPAMSPDGARIAYTVAEEGRFEIWIADRDGGNARYVDAGRHPRFSSTGNAIVYSRTGLDGNRDIWRFDLLAETPERLTDHPEIDDAPDWSPDGTSIVFHSNRGGHFSLWRLPASGGRRSRLPADGFAPRFSPDGTRIAFWNRGRLWTMGTDDTEASGGAEVPRPAYVAWDESGPAYFDGQAIQTSRGRLESGPIGEVFDRWPEGGWLVSTLQVERSELWALDLTYEEQ